MSTISTIVRIDGSISSSYPSPISPGSTSDFSVDDEIIPDLVRSDENPTSPPQVIRLKNLEPLNLAKTKHYTRHQAASKIQKKMGNVKPQGRPFNDSLKARFLFFQTVDDLISSILNHKDHDTVRLVDDFNSLNSKLDEAHSQTVKTNNRPLIIDLILQNSLNMNVKSLENIKFQLQSIEFENYNKNSIHQELCKILNTPEFSFVKIIRNNKGRLIKFEILSQVDNDKIDINFVKKYITFPRYKSNMKIYLINGKFDKNVWFYNDLRMLLWEMDNLDISGKRVLVNNLILT
jgi:hypothetical protein